MRTKPPVSLNLSFRAPADWPLTEIFLDVLGYVDGAEWTAIALDMDLQGFGKTFDEARAALAELVVAQFTFAIQKREPRLILKPAAPLYWQMYERERREALVSHIASTPRRNPSVRVGNLAVPQELVAQYQSRKKPFQRQRAA